MKRFVGMLKEGENWTDLPKELQKEAMGKSFELNGGKTGFTDDLLSTDLRLLC